VRWAADATTTKTSRIGRKKPTTRANTTPDQRTVNEQHVVSSSLRSRERPKAWVCLAQHEGNTIMLGTSRAVAVALVVVVVVVIVAIAGIALAARRRKQTRTEARRREAADARDLAKVSMLEADRQTAEAEERAARAKRERLAAEQSQLAAAAQRSSAHELQLHADEIDPDVRTGERNG
jgi:hypothetical protein